MCGVLLTDGVSNKNNNPLRPAVVDHIIPHHGNEELFNSRANVWAICSDDHDSICQRLERDGTAQQIRERKLSHKAIDINGYTKIQGIRAVENEQGFNYTHLIGGG
jgi:5-methylcytosine-specific restriction endonuclease McrA